MVTETPDEYVVTTVNDLELRVVRGEGTVVILTPPGKKIFTGLVLNHGQAFQLGRALCELGFFDEDGH
jgi:hypothetical protein